MVGSNGTKVEAEKGLHQQIQVPMIGCSHTHLMAPERERVYGENRRDLLVVSPNIQPCWEPWLHLHPLSSFCHWQLRAGFEKQRLTLLEAVVSHDPALQLHGKTQN